MRRSRADRREELLRPSRYLGYDRDQLGVYLLGRGAYDLAESQFRRAVWLNPFEPRFKLHWAASLLRLERRAEAANLLAGVLREQPRNALARRLCDHYGLALDGDDAAKDGRAVPNVTE